MVDDKIISLAAARKKAKVKPKYPPLLRRDAQTKINKIAKDSSAVHWGGHGEGQKNLRDFIYSDIVEILREGIIREAPRLGKFGDWGYKVEVPNFWGGRSAGVVAIIQEGKDKSKDKLFVKTVMWID